ncbi:MAG: hypothetical protein J6D03_07060 [Clostridia bacterium]|nr:hypothetical protein [Clostridia bacterium]
MKLKTNFKILLMFGIMLVTMLLIGTTKVEASTYEYNCDWISGNVTCNNGKITITRLEKENNQEIIIELEKLEDIVGVTESSKLIMNQTNINKFINDRDINYTVKKKVGNNVTSAKTVDGKTIEIEKINNENWLILKGTIHYKAECSEKGHKNNDIRNVEYGWSLDYYENEDKNTLYLSFSIETDLTVNQNTFFQEEFVNEHNVDYTIGGYGGGDSSYSYFSYLYPIYDDNSTYDNPCGIIPSNKDLSKVYLKLSLEQYQGEKIVLENSKDILYYEGIEKNYSGERVYVYKRKVSEIKLQNGHRGLFNYKLKNGTEIPTYFVYNYMLSENEKEETVTINDNTKNEQNVDNKVNVNYWGSAKFDISKIETTDSIYNNVKNEIDENTSNYNNSIYLSIFDIYRVSGNYGGKLKLTFNVGEQYNGKYYYVSHRINYGNFERFEGIVKDGKIEITVDSLSPFGISIFEDKKETTPPTETEIPTQTVDKGEKDETPKTGTVDIIGFVSLVTLVSLVGIVELKKRLK